MAELRNWTAIFDAGEYLFALKEFSTAGLCFDYLADKFPSRELLNNAGVCHFFEAMQYANTKDMPFMLPVEFDPNTRLKSSGNRSGEMSDEQRLKLRNELLHKAVRYFDLAKQRDPAYLNATINNACCLVMLNKEGTAIDIANDVISNSQNAKNSYSISKGYTLRAIAKWQSEKRDEALKDFKQAEAFSFNSLTAYNTAASRNLEKNMWESFVYYVYDYFSTDNKKIAEAEKSFNPDLEKINGMNAKGMILNDNYKKITISTPLPFSIYTLNEKFNGSILIAHGGKQWSFSYTNAGYPYNTNQGVGLNAPKNLIKEKYGEPTYSLKVLKGEYLVYTKSRIAFLMNRNDRLEKWISYYTK